VHSESVFSEQIEKTAVFELNLVTSFRTSVISVGRILQLYLVVSAFNRKLLMGELCC